MGVTLWAVAGALVGAIVTSLAPRRSAALAELQAALGEQRTRLDGYSARISHLEREVTECERGRTADRQAFAAEIAELRARLT